MKTILDALKEEGKATDEDARTIARALGGTTIATAISPADSDEESSEKATTNGAE